MIFNDHSKLRGGHALLSPSQPSWLRYDEEKLFDKYSSTYAQTIGTLLHELAETLIINGVKLRKDDDRILLVHLLGHGIPRNVIDLDRIFSNFREYVNDAIGFRLTPEQILYYSDYCYGTADAITFKNNILRIHDYKSGTTPAKMEQLLVYAALFCLEYRFKPSDIEIELRIYQNDEVVVHKPEVDEILPVMDTIICHTRSLEKMNEEG